MDNYLQLFQKSCRDSKESMMHVHEQIVDEEEEQKGGHIETGGNN
jgi:hypothetical protein